LRLADGTLQALTVSVPSLPDEQRQVREWLFLLLRFAITRDVKDRAAVVAMAEIMDGVDLRWRPSGPTFFTRTTEAACRAIADQQDPAGAAVLRTLVRRIDDYRLQRAIAAVLELQISHAAGRARSGRPRVAVDLWRGLRSRS
jgi:hypothetical protein